MNSFLISMVTYVICIATLMNHGDTNFLSLGLIFMGCVILPFALGTADLLATLLVRARR